MFIRLTEEQMKNIRKNMEEFDKKYSEAYENKLKALAKLNEEQNSIRDEIKELREKANKLEEQLNNNLKNGVHQVNRTFKETVGHARKEYEDTFNKVYSEAIGSQTENTEDPFERLLKAIFGVENLEHIKSDKQSHKEELTEEEMLDYIKKAQLHEVAELYYNLRDLKVVQIRKERVCEHCGRVAVPYKYMISTSRYFDKNTSKSFSDFWDDNSEVTNRSGIIEVVDNETGEIVTLAKKVMYSDIKCVYERVLEAEKLTEEFKKSFTDLIDIGYREI